MSEDNNNTSDVSTEAFDEVFDRSFKAAKKPGQKTFGDYLSMIVSKVYFFALIIVLIMVLGGVGVLFY